MKQVCKYVQMKEMFEFIIRYMIFIGEDLQEDTCPFKHLQQTNQSLFCDEALWWEIGDECTVQRGLLKTCNQKEKLHPGFLLSVKQLHASHS